MTSAKENYVKRVIGWAIWPVRILLIVTIAAAIIPLSPAMPGPGLDASWMYGLGEAVALKLAFGREMVFTQGPYVSIYTASYHPATYHFVLFGSACMALGFSILLLYLLAGRSLLLSLLMIFFLACNGGAPDATLLLYPLLLSLFIYRLTLEIDTERQMLSRAPLAYLVIFVLFGVLGLIPLIKGSLLILAAATGGLCVLRLYLTGFARLAIVALIASIVGLFAFWIVTGQLLSDLPSYFTSMLPIASGYTEAMSSKGKSAQISIYLISCVVSAAAVLFTRSLAWRNRIYLLATFGLFLFLAFKEGFVRHDTHATIAGSALFLAGVTLCMVFETSTRWISLALCIAGWFAICSFYYPITVPSTLTAAKNEYARLGNGLWASIRGTRNLAEDFEKARAQLRQEHPIPAMKGTSDIYPFDQSYLLASDNNWLPRPIFQSYSAYTPKLADINRRHLESPASPDNILLSLQPIDQRLAALEDGPSWPALIGLYKPVRYQDGYIYLEKRGADARTPDVKPLLDRTYGMGEIVTIPDTQFPIFTHIRMKRTFLEHVLSVIFKPEELRITVTLLDGSSRDYRFIPGMGEAGFVLSPLVENTSDFLKSYDSWKCLENKRVTSIRIWTQSKHALSWAGYQLTLGELVSREETDVSALTALTAPNRIAGNSQPLREADCLGSMDSFNTSLPAGHTASYPPVVSTRLRTADGRGTFDERSFLDAPTGSRDSIHGLPLLRYERVGATVYLSPREEPWKDAQELTSTVLTYKAS